MNNVTIITISNLAIPSLVLDGLPRLLSLSLKNTLVGNLVVAQGSLLTLTVVALNRCFIAHKDTISLVDASPSVTWCRTNRIYGLKRDTIVHMRKAWPKLKGLFMSYNNGDLPNNVVDDFRTPEPRDSSDDDYDCGRDACSRNSYDS